MGSWNQTCGVTHLPIQWDDPVAVICLTQIYQREESDHTLGFCYPNQFWSPRYLPIYAKYNDYGAAEDFEENFNTAYILESLKENLIEKEVGENTVHDIAVKKEGFDLETLFETVREDRLEVSQNMLFPGDPDRAKIGMMMVHRWAYDFMATYHDQEYVVSEGEHLKGELEIFYNSVKEYVNEADEFQIKMIRNHADFALQKMSSKFLRYFSAERIDNYGVTAGISSYKDMIIKMAVDDVPFTDPRMQEIGDELCRFMIFNGNMNLARRTYMPQSGAGSQSTCFELYRALNRKSEEYMAAKDAKMREWD